MMDRLRYQLIDQRGYLTQNETYLLNQAFSFWIKTWETAFQELNWIFGLARMISIGRIW